jgi:hypothetical protein
VTTVECIGGPCDGVERVARLVGTFAWVEEHEPNRVRRAQTPGTALYMVEREEEERVQLAYVGNAVARCSSCGAYTPRRAACGVCGCPVA